MRHSRINNRSYQSHNQSANLVSQNQSNTQDLTVSHSLLTKSCSICKKSNHVDQYCYFNPNYCFLHDSYRHSAINCLKLRSQLDQNYGPRSNVQSHISNESHNSNESHESHKSLSRGRSQIKQKRDRHSSNSTHRYISGQQNSNHSEMDFLIIKLLPEIT